VGSKSEVKDVRLSLVLSLVTLFSIGFVSSRDQAPNWPSSYEVKGTLSIPFAEIEEPFSAWVDLDQSKSRIDYYNGMVKTFQRGDLKTYGTSVKILPMTNEIVANEIDCFQVDGGQDGPVTAQSMLPDISDFELLGKELKNGDKCQKWQKIERIGGKTNKYTMWIKEDNGSPVPVHYEMKGFNTLLGSHYDHYFITYRDFKVENLDQSDVFDIYLKKDCHGWPGPGIDHVYTMNPMKEFINNHDQHVHDTFEKFKIDHGRVYDTDREHIKRLELYRQNMRFISSKNRQGLSYSLASNHLADKSQEEMKVLRGRIYDSSLKYNGGQPQVYTKRMITDAPDTLDWRLYGAVTPVKDQSVCGSCWSFGSVGTLEGALFLQTGNLVRLSQQALIDCSWGFGNNGCDGGEDWRVYQWMIKHGGIPTEDSYGPYLGQDGYCHVNKSEMGLKIKSWVNVTSGDVDALKVAIASHGPVSVAIDASHKSLSFYSNGVYYEKECNNDVAGLDHAVLAVGYGELNGEKYWLVKNSWSTYWGNDGYVLMSQKNNNCGVATAATYVVPDMS